MHLTCRGSGLGRMLQLQPWQLPGKVQVWQASSPMPAWAYKPDSGLMVLCSNVLRPPLCFADNNNNNNGGGYGGVNNSKSTFLSPSLAGLPDAVGFVEFA